MPNHAAISCKQRHKKHEITMSTDVDYNHSHYQSVTILNRRIMSTLKIDDKRTAITSSMPFFLSYHYHIIEYLFELWKIKIIGFQ